MPESFGLETTNLASIPPLPRNAVHVFAISLTPDPDWQSEALRVMDQAEHERAARFRFEIDRYRFQKTRAALRLILSRYLSMQATGLVFGEGSHGKPYLEPPAGDLQFNVSHTRGAAALAFAYGIELGIDIEHASRSVDISGVGQRVFTPAEMASFDGLGEASSLRQFFRLWTAKEAYLKATGSGLSCDPSSIETQLESGRYTSAASPFAPLPYTLREIDTRNNFLISLAHQHHTSPLDISAFELL